MVTNSLEDVEDIPSFSQDLQTPLKVMLPREGKAGPEIPGKE